MISLYMIFVLGVTSLLQLVEINYYCRQLLYFFKNSKNISDFIEKCEVDINVLKRQDVNESLNAAIDERKQQKRTKRLGEQRTLTQLMASSSEEESVEEEEESVEEDIETESVEEGTGKK